LTGLGAALAMWRRCSKLPQHRSNYLCGLRLYSEEGSSNTTSAEAFQTVQLYTSIDYHC
jgi:hypothetical protein